MDRSISHYSNAGIRSIGVTSSGKIDLFTKLVTFDVVLSLVLETYGLSFGDFSFIFTSLLAIYNIFIRNKRIKSLKLPYFLSAYFLYYGINNILTASSLSGMFPMGALKAFMVCLLFYDVLRYDYLIKIYRIIAIVSIGFFIIQEVSYHTIGTRVLGIIPFLPRMTRFDSYYMAIASASERSSSFFSEPAMFAHFLLPLLCVELFRKKKNVILILSIAGTLLLLRSGNAILGVVPVIIVFVFSILRRSNYNVFLRFFLFAATLATIVAFTYYYVQTEAGSALMERSEEVDLETVGSRSGYQRIYRGYFVYGDMGLAGQIFGKASPDAVRQSVKQSHVSGEFEKGDLYFNTIHTILIRTGAIGALLILMFFFKSWKNNFYVGKSMILVLLSESLISNNFFSNTMILMIYMISANQWLKKNGCTDFI